MIDFIFISILLIYMEIAIGYACFKLGKRANIGSQTTYTISLKDGYYTTDVPGIDDLRFNTLEQAITSAKHAIRGYKAGVREAMNNETSNKEKICM